MYWNNYGAGFVEERPQIAGHEVPRPDGQPDRKRLYHFAGTGAGDPTARHALCSGRAGNPLAVRVAWAATHGRPEFNPYGQQPACMLINGGHLVAPPAPQPWLSVYLSPAGNVAYELSNHLGNVMTVISDKITPIDTTNDGLWDYFNPSLVSAIDYYPFGMGMPGDILTMVLIRIWI